ncbi:MAG: DUF1727 domain-containing protein [Propionibacteriaceae bacterium]|nr:DUF1727 domain-containing protein [Propionibacteriaceae bacterium]
MRAIGRKASTFPGLVAIKVCPQFLSAIAKPPVVVCVSGTNGKTTTTNMIADCLVADGRTVVTNRAGANINTGVATALMKGVSLTGKVLSDAAVLEIDEKYCPLILPFVAPHYLVVTNIFRDSLKRNAHPEFIFDIINSSIPRETTLIINADDLGSNQLAPDNTRILYGIDALPSDVETSVNLITDHAACPVCDTLLKHHYLRYHHIGRSWCPACGFSSPQPDSSAQVTGSTMVVTTQGEPEDYPVINPLVFNLYNELAVICLLRHMGIPSQKVATLMGNLAVTDSRLDETTVGRWTIIQAMAKGQSAVSTTRTLDFVKDTDQPSLVILLLDDYYDRVNTSEFIGWIYDADFEFLATDNIRQIAALGPRCDDYIVRLLIAGVDRERIFADRDEFARLNELDYTDVSRIYLLYDSGTYELAMKVKHAVIAHCKSVGRVP